MRKMRKFLTMLTLMLVTLSSTIFAQGFPALGSSKINLDEEIKLDGKVRYGKLANGLTYYIKTNRTPENRAEFQLAVNAGSVLETEAEVGLAHFTEHMGFNGTKFYPGNEMIDALEKEGIVFGRQINAYTGFDQTVYMVTLPTDKDELFNMGLKILDGWAFSMLMTGDEIDAERGVIIEEWRTGQGAQDRLRAKTWPTMLKGSLYPERLPIGTLENLENFEHETIRGFYKKWYRPDNMAVIVVGDFDADEMEKQVIDYFSMNDAPTTPLNRPVPDIPDNKEPLIAIATDKEAVGNSIQYFYKHPAQDVKTIGDYRTRYLVYSLYSEMFNARLREISDKKNSPFMGAGAAYTSFISRKTDAYYNSISAKDGRILDALNVMMVENKRVVDHGFVATELERAKESLLTRYERHAKEESKAESSRFAAEYVEHFLEGDPAPGARIEYRWARELVDDITLEEVNSLAGQWITDENFVLVLTMAEEEGKKKRRSKIPTEKDILKTMKKVEKTKTKPYIDNVKTEPFLVKEPKAGKVSKRVDNEKFDYTELTLSNGATVILKSTDFKNDEILLSAWSPGGTSLYPDSKIMNANYAASIVDASGIGNYDHSDLIKFLKGKTVGVSPYISELEEGFRGSSSPKDFEILLQYLYMFFEAPRKDKDVLDREISKLETQINMLKNMPEFDFQIELMKTTYPQDKRSILIPTEAQLKQLNINEIYKIFRERFSDASDFTFTFVGNIDIDETIPLIEKYIGSLPSKGKKEEWINRSTPFAKGLVDKVVYKGQEKGMMVLAAEMDFEWNDKERMATSILGDIVSIKLVETIREEMGGTYSPTFILSYEAYPEPTSTFMAIYSCDPETVDELTDATWEVFDEIMENGPTDVDLAKVKEQMIRARETAVEKNNYWNSAIKGSRWYEFDLRTFEEYSAFVNSITLEDVHAVAKKYLDYKEHVRVSLKPESMDPSKN